MVVTRCLSHHLGNFASLLLSPQSTATRACSCFPSLNSSLRLRFIDTLPEHSIDVGRFDSRQPWHFSSHDRNGRSVRLTLQDAHSYGFSKSSSYKLTVLLRLGLDLSAFGNTPQANLQTVERALAQHVDYGLTSASSLPLHVNHHTIRGVRSVNQHAVHVTTLQALS